MAIYNNLICRCVDLIYVLLCDCVLYSFGVFICNSMIQLIIFNESDLVIICNVYLFTTDIDENMPNLLHLRAEKTVILSLKCINISGLTLEFRASHWQEVS